VPRHPGRRRQLLRFDADFLLERLLDERFAEDFRAEERLLVLFFLAPPVLAVERLLPDVLLLRLRGTFAPFSRASERPIAIACLRLFTFRPEPLLRVPDFRLCIARLTLFPAALPYLRPPELFFAAICRTLRE
jgi:hypothetical protein